jgi:hypothetical protein
MTVNLGANFHEMTWTCWDVRVTYTRAKVEYIANEKTNDLWARRVLGMRQGS